MIIYFLSFVLRIILIAAVRHDHRDRTGIDWVIKRKRAGKRAARLFKNAENTSANDNVEFAYAVAA
jgi:hypothetical protein